MWHKRACRSSSAGGSAADVAAQRRCCCRCCCLQRLPHLLCTRGHNSASGAAVTARVTRHVLIMPHCEERQSVTPSFPSRALYHPGLQSIPAPAIQRACVRSATKGWPTPHLLSARVCMCSRSRAAVHCWQLLQWHGTGLLLRLVRAVHVFVRAHSRIAMAASSGGGDGF